MRAWIPGRPRQRRLGLALLLLASLVWTLLPPTAPAAPEPAEPTPATGPDSRVASQTAPFSPTEQPPDDEAGNARLEARQPSVQWSPAGAADWQPVEGMLTVRAGDRVRTDATAAVRLSYTQDTRTDLGPATGLLVQRLERGADGSVAGALFQTGGTTVHRPGPVTNPPVHVEIETPAARALAAGATLRVEVAPGGATRLAILPEGPTGPIEVQALDPANTLLALLPGREVEIAPGQPPSAPVPLGAQPPPAPPSPSAAPRPASPPPSRSPSQTIAAPGPPSSAAAPARSDPSPTRIA